MPTNCGPNRYQPASNKGKSRPLLANTRSREFARPALSLIFGLPAVVALDRDGTTWVVQWDKPDTSLPRWAHS